MTSSQWKKKKVIGVSKRVRKNTYSLSLECNVFFFTFSFYISFVRWWNCKLTFKQSNAATAAAQIDLFIFILFLNFVSFFCRRHLQQQNGREMNICTNKMNALRLFTVSLSIETWPRHSRANKIAKNQNMRSIRNVWNDRSTLQNNNKNKIAHNSNKTNSTLHRYGHRQAIFDGKKKNNNCFHHLNRSGSNILNFERSQERAEKAFCLTLFEVRSICGKYIYHGTQFSTVWRANVHNYAFLSHLICWFFSLSLSLSRLIQLNERKINCIFWFAYLSTFVRHHNKIIYVHQIPNDLNFSQTIWSDKITKCMQNEFEYECVCVIVRVDWIGSNRIPIFCYLFFWFRIFCFGKRDKHSRDYSPATFFTIDRSKEIATHTIQWWCHSLCMMHFGIGKFHSMKFTYTHWIENRYTHFLSIRLQIVKMPQKNKRLYMFVSVCINSRVSFN